MEQAMKLFAISAPTPEEMKASFQDRTANIIRVTYNAGIALIGSGAAFAIHDSAWFFIPVAIGGLLFLVSLLASYDFARGPGWATASLALPSSKFTLAVSLSVVLACLGVMTFAGDKLELSVSQWGRIGTSSWLFTFYISGLCEFYFQRRSNS
jgi:hypothetical protein